MLAVMAVVLTAALLVFTYGFASLILDRDVITQADAGTLLGPLMFLAPLAIVARSVLAPWAERVSRQAIAAATAAVLIGPAVGAVVYAIERSQLAVIPLFYVTYIVSPFVLLSGVVVGAVAAVTGFIDRSMRGPASDI